MNNTKDHTIFRVPTNVITGFLGVGKTTVILNLLKQKSKHKRWAILVNEFGEVGIDGSLIEGQHNENQGVFIREVPGGCMCCTAGLPMQIALNQLLTRAKPDRLIIEPTGLGHPKEVLQTLSADHYHDILDIQQCITLVDARNLNDTRYTDHATFNQQIDMADQIIGHKADLYSTNDHNNLHNYIKKRRGKDIAIHLAQQGNIDVSLLQGQSSIMGKLNPPSHNHSAQKTPNINTQNFPSCGYLKIENTGEGFRSIGWRFSPKKIFNRSLLFSWLSGLQVERAKGVFITHEGIYGYNLTTDALTEITLDDCLESRIEIITNNISCICEDDLLQCLNL